MAATDWPLPASSDFWNDKKPAEWSDGQTQEFLRKSPWVRYFGGLEVRSDACSVGPQPGPPRATHGGAVIPHSSGCFDSFPMGSLVIRWESAALVQEVLTRIESKEYNDALARFSRDYYVIAVVRLFPDGNLTAQTRLSGHWSPEQEEALRDAIARQPPRQHMWDAPIPIPMLVGNEEAKRAFSASRLSRPGYDAISPARVECGQKMGSTSVVLFRSGPESTARVIRVIRAESRGKDAVDLLMFPRSLALESGSGDIEISTTVQLGMGHTTFRATFSLKVLTEGSERGL